MTSTTEQPAPHAPDLPDRVRMPLLTLITQQSLDADYLVAAERRAAGAPRPPSGRPRRTAALVVVVFGLLVTTAFVQTQRNAAVDNESRTALIDRITSEKRVVARDQERQANLDDRNASGQQTLTTLTSQQEAATARTGRLEVPTGFGAVTGPGVRITVTQRANPDQDQMVRDQDLAKLVNGLWGAGAEAISVNGQRLTATSAIRTSGAAIEVNGVGIAPPYTVLAIGDTRTLQARLIDTVTGSEFVSLADEDGFFSYSVENVSSLSLPAAPARLGVLRSADTDFGTPPDGPREEHDR